MSDENKRSGLDRVGESSRIFLMRHGETEWNKNFRYQGSSDVPLSEAGCEQARLLGLRMSCVAPARVLSSPLSRAFGTAEIVMCENKTDVSIDKMDDLREISFGDWEGRTVFEVQDMDGATIDKWKHSPFSATPKGGEPIEEVRRRSARAADFLRKVCAPGEATFVFAHGAILRSLLSELIGIEDMGVLWRMRVDNCSITIVDFWDGRPSLYTLNDTTHLRADESCVPSLNFCQ